MLPAAERLDGAEKRCAESLVPADLCRVCKNGGIGVITVAGFLTEVGDVRRFESPRQIQKLAGLSLREDCDQL